MMMTMIALMWKENRMKNMNGLDRLEFARPLCWRGDFLRQVCRVMFKFHIKIGKKIFFHFTGVGTFVTNASHNNDDDDDEDLNVDGDDTQIYGTPQYTERDVILPIVDTHKKETLYLRNLVIGETSTVDIPPHIKSEQTANSIDTLSSEQINGQSNANGESSNNNVQIQSSNENKVMNEGDDITKNTNCSNDEQMQSSSLVSRDSALHIIEALKEKIREYEIIIKNKSKCLICMDDFRVPVVSICCWHVHCEECWLRTLGARKLCPQCNMITSPADLRKIYM